MQWEEKVAAGKRLRGDRERMLAKAGALIDWLAANPDVPVSSVEFRHSVIAESHAEGLGEIGAVAKAAGLPITVSNHGRHHTVVKTDQDDPLGLVSYQAAYIKPDPWKPRYRKPTREAEQVIRDALTATRRELEANE